MSAPACEKCGSDLVMLSEESPVGPVLQCSGCGRSVAARAVRTLKLPGLDPGRQEVLVRENEEPVLQRVTRALQMAGYQVETLVRRRKMQHCETCDAWFHQQGGDGVSKYVGDLLVAVPRERPDRWIMFDTKGWRGRGSAEQKETAAKGLLFFVKTEAEALCIAGRFEIKQQTNE